MSKRDFNKVALQGYLRLMNVLESILKRIKLRTSKFLVRK